MAYPEIKHQLSDESGYIDVLATDALYLLKELIATPSFSGEEALTAHLLQQFMQHRGIKTNRLHNNIWAYNKHYDAAKPTILLNSHHDTVKPNEGYTRNPFKADIVADKLYGLGSNDAGGCLVSLLAVFAYFYNDATLAYNLCFAATGEEENSGSKGLNAILPLIGTVDFAIVGEPTKMQMATAEMGNIVLDCVAYGIAGHAARNEGDNALYKAIKDISWFSSYCFPKQSAFMGPIKMTVTQISAGLQHNIIPHECRFTVDVRLSDCYTPEEVLSIIGQNTACTITQRQGMLKPSCIAHIHPLVRAGVALGLSTYLSPTSSDQGWLNVPSLKMGPGDSARSHTADEFIFVREISEGIDTYIALLKSLMYCLIHNPAAGKTFNNSRGDGN